jgi:hypothetical protein
MQSDTSSPTGRTGWDVLYAVRRILLFVIVTVIASIVVIAVYLTDPDALSAAAEAIGPYASLLVFPVVGAVVCRLTLKSFYIPRYSAGINLDMETCICRVIMIPDERLRTLEGKGDIVLFHTPSGRPVYLIRKITEDSLDFGWIHSARPEIIFSERRLFIRFRQTLEDVLMDNLQLMADANIIAADMARGAMGGLMDRLSESLGYRRPDLKVREEKKKQEFRGEEELPDPERYGPDEEYGGDDRE